MSRFDWDDLRFFLAVARVGRLTVAARRLGADHATVSRRITALEDALKAKLFERRPQGYALTEHGERLLSNARRIVALIDDGRLLVLAACGDRFEQVASYRVAEGDTYAPPVLLQDGILVKDLETLTFWSLTHSANPPQ